MTSVRFPFSAKQRASVTTVVVFPTPPRWLQTRSRINLIPPFEDETNCLQFVAVPQSPVLTEHGGGRLDPSVSKPALERAHRDREDTAEFAIEQEIRPFHF